MITGLDYPLKNVQKGRRGLNKYIWGATFHGMKVNEMFPSLANMKKTDLK